MKQHAGRTHTRTRTHTRVVVPLTSREIGRRRVRSPSSRRSPFPVARLKDASETEGHADPRRDEAVFTTPLVDSRDLRGRRQPRIGLRSSPNSHISRKYAKTFCTAKNGALSTRELPRESAEYETCNKCYREELRAPGTLGRSIENSSYFWDIFED